MGAFESGPRPLSQKSDIDEAKSDQAVKDGIHPTIDWHEYGSGIGRRGIPVTTKELAHRGPGGTGEFRIVVAAIDVLRDEVAEEAADEDVRGKMLASTYSRETYGRSGAVSQNLAQWPGILVRDDSRDGPGRRRVLRGK